MSFRKKSIPIGSSNAAAKPKDVPIREAPVKPPGTRPSPLNGSLVTSTGASSLDELLGGHRGMPVGTSLLIEEPGTTDFSSVLLRYFAAEGVEQGHCVMVVGAGERWGLSLPGVMGVADYTEEVQANKGSQEKMKIAWRYERLGEYGSGIGGSKAQSLASQSGTTSTPFCHTFDLSKRLEPGSSSQPITYLGPSPSTTQPYAQVLEAIQKRLEETPPSTFHRLVIPSFLSPILYPPQACSTPKALHFLYGLRALLRAYPTRLVAMLSLPIELFPRGDTTTKWAEVLSDVVIQLTPAVMDQPKKPLESGEEVPQGVVSFWKLYEGDNVPKEDLGFVQSRRRFRVIAWSLPPVEAEEPAHDHAHAHGSKESAKSLEF